ncbi:MAG TPA: DNA topoisomerase IB [Frankiaceae bacterium]|nr:DNA topoisomerase IB [Frankiaceae bacterium]
MRLRRSDLAAAGITRRRRGKGFTYRDASDQPINDPETLDRIEALVIPPAWEDVWISPHAAGHIQAVGTDAAGRRQYRYHDEWRCKRDLEKFDRILDFADMLPALRLRVKKDLELAGMPERRVLACAARMLDIGFFRVGGEEYAEQNSTFGLATIRREHTSVDGEGTVTFDYPAKSGKQRLAAVADPEVCEVVATLLAREDDDDPELLAFRDDDGHWVNVNSRAINAYLADVTGGAAISAKDFRTWSATVLCAVALAVSEQAATSPTAIKRAVTRAVKETSDYLGNTPAVCRASYIHPRVIDLFHGGVTIHEDLQSIGEGSGYGQLAFQGDVEAAVVSLLRSPQAARAASRRIRLAEAAQRRTVHKRPAATAIVPPSTGRAA